MYEWRMSYVNGVWLYVGPVFGLNRGSIRGYRAWCWWKRNGGGRSRFILFYYHVMLSTLIKKSVQLVCSMKNKME